MVSKSHTCEELVPNFHTCENWYQIIKDVKDWYLIVTYVRYKTVKNWNQMQNAADFWDILSKGEIHVRMSATWNLTCVLSQRVRYWYETVTYWYQF